MTRPRAAALAAAGTLTAGDLRGYKTVKPDPEDEATAAAEERDFMICMRGTARTFVADRDAEYEKGELGIRSGAHVAPTRARAKEYLAVERHRTARSCREIVLRQDLPSGVRLAPVQWRDLLVDVPGADETFGYAATVTARGPGGSLVATYSRVSALVGPTEVWIEAFAPGPDVPHDTLLRLLRTATARVKRVPPA